MSKKKITSQWSLDGKRVQGKRAKAEEVEEALQTARTWARSWWTKKRSNGEEKKINLEETKKEGGEMCDYSQEVAPVVVGGEFLILDDYYFYSYATTLTIYFYVTFGDYFFRT